MSISHLVSKLTVRIEGKLAHGLSVGTGFWFGFRLNDEHITPCLVTNKHVIEGAQSVDLILNVNSLSDPQLKFMDVNIDKANFLPHPDKDIDLCILPALNILNAIKHQGIDVDIEFLLDDHFLGEKQITPIEDVFMTGYPNGLWDHINNRPITRKGITASSPLENWQGKPVFMIDMACYGGSSGSPVFILNEGSFMNEGNLVVGERLIFLGILYAGPTVTAQGSIEIVEIPTASTAAVRTELMMNLGIVIRAEKLNDFKPMLKMK